MKLIFLFVLASLAAHAAPPNVLFIAADDLRNDLGCYGDPLVKSPNLDRLAARGVRFDRAYCQQAVCNPSRASLMTGRRLDTLRIWDLPTHFRSTMPDVVTLPQHFKQHGYFTQNVGKIFHNWIHEVQGDPASWSVPAVMHFANHGADKPLVDGALPPNLAHDPKCEQRDVPDEAYFDGRVAKLAVEALRERKKKGEPFFLAVGFWKPHSPFNAPKRYWDMYRREEIPMPKNPDWPKDAPRIAWHDGREILGSGEKARKITTENIREMRHGYLANISYMDAQIGRVLDELDRLKLADNTIVVFWSDHGFHLGEQTLWAKTSNFELDARVPLIIAAPGINPAKTNALAELLDLYPTLADLCGLPKPNGTEGASLAPVLRDPQSSVKQAALTQHPRPAYYDREAMKAPTAMGYSVRSDRFRYTEWRDWKTGETTARELYDHQADPDETRNVAAAPEHHRDVEASAALLRGLRPVVQPGWKPLLR
ncbi:MAG: sulfatase [Chthoniobacteraceae bacterium]